MANDAAVTVVDLGHAFRPGEWLFRHVHMEIPTGGALAVLGPNGRGKSTLLRCLACLTKPLEGRSIVAPQLAFVPATVHVEFSYSVFQMVLMGRARSVSLFGQPSTRDHRIAREALNRLQIAHLADQPWDTLSGGERQLALMSRAIASEARTLFLDEPTASLDPHNQVRVIHWLRKLVRDDHMTLIFTTHDPNQAQALATHTLMMFENAEHRGGPSADILNEQNLSNLFSCEIRAVKSATNEASARHFVTSFAPQGQSD